ncbi:MAG: SulP family inorganic anion transporter [Frankiaceae bacterium]
MRLARGRARPARGSARPAAGRASLAVGRARLVRGFARLAHLAPGVAQARSYQRAWLRGDIIGGVTVAAYLVPQVMAYAGLAGLPPVTGLWAIIPALALYALFGSSPQLSVGPESTTALMAAAVVGPLAAGQPGRYADLAAALAVIVGVLALAAWVLRLGFVADLLSQPTLVGYMTGVALIMMVGQLQKVTGVPVHGDTFFAEIRSFVSGVGELQAGTAGLAAVTLAFLLVLQWRFPRIPGPLLAVLLATLAVGLFDLDAHGIAVVGTVPSGLPTPSVPAAGDLQEMVLPATGVLLVGYTDVVLTARAFATHSGHTIDANQELLAVGASNIGAGLVRGFPVSSSASRTAIGDASGTRTQLHSLVALASVVAVLLFLGPLLARFPTASLGALVIYAAIRLIDIPGFRRLAAFRRTEALLALAACAGVLLFDILYGILLAIGLSVVDLLARVARPHDAVLGRIPGLAGMHDIDDYPEAKLVPGLVVYRYDSPLFFANAQDFRHRALAAVGASPTPVAWFVLNTEAIVDVDMTAVDALEEVRTTLAGRGIVFAMARVKQELLQQLQAAGFADQIGRDRIFPTLPTAVAGYEQWQRARRAHNGGSER